jgi:hypothetical protein
MPVRLGRFEMPKRLVKDKPPPRRTTPSSFAEPFETGYGHTIGNSLRRVLLSSLEGAAITSVKIDGAMHEFTTIEGVVEDVTDIVLNLKKIKFKAHTRDPADAAAQRQQGRRGHRRRHPPQPEHRTGQPAADHLHPRQEEEVRDGARGRSAAGSVPATRTRRSTSRSG